MTDISYKHAHRERETFGHPEKTRFHIVSVGWGASLITSLLDQIEARTDYRISHIVFDPDLVVLERQRGLKGVYRLRDHPRGSCRSRTPGCWALWSDQASRRSTT